MARAVRSFATALHAALIVALVVVMSLGVARAKPGAGQPHAHVYLFRGLADVFSTGMDVLAQELNQRGVEASSHSHTDWKAIADKVIAEYKAGKIAPIILVGHSLGADAVMEMADYLGDSGVPVALLVPFDGTQSFPVPANVTRMVNFTQRDYAHMRPGPGFRGTLLNVDLSGDSSIDHLNIDKNARLHTRVIDDVMAITAGRRIPVPKPAGAVTVGRPGEASGATPEAKSETKPDVKPAPRQDSKETKPDTGNGTPIIAAPERRQPNGITSAPPALPPAPAPPVVSSPPVPAPVAASPPPAPSTAPPGAPKPAPRVIDIPN
jgi:pimeloyl-ACP methyl ester carboxylesterase